MWYNMNNEGINHDEDVLVIDNEDLNTKTNNFTDLLIAKKEYEFYQKELITQQTILDDKKKGFTAFLKNQDPLYVKYNPTASTSGYFQNVPSVRGFCS